MTTNLPKSELMEFAWEEVTRCLLAERGINRGLWRLAVKVHFAAMTAQAETAPGGTLTAMPTAAIGMGALMLQPVTAPGLLVFDAATIGKRPAKLPAKKATAKKPGSTRTRALAGARTRATG